MFQCGIRPIFERSCLETADIGVTLCMIGCYYLFVSGKTKNRLFGAKRLSFKVDALRMKFNIIERHWLSGFCTKDDGWCDKWS